MPKVIVYIKAADARSLEAEGADPAVWVRELVWKALKERREKEK